MNRVILFMIAILSGAYGCNSANSAQQICTPGGTQLCVCPGGGAGAQACNIDGKSWGQCQGCPGSLSDSGINRTDASGFDKSIIKEDAYRKDVCMPMDAKTIEWRLDQNSFKFDHGVTDSTSSSKVETRLKEAGITDAGNGCAACTTNQECIQNACYQKCTRSGICNATQDCPPNQACMQYAPTNSWVCRTAAQPGQTCGNDKGCTNGYVCASTNGVTYLCLPVCPTVGAACGTNNTGTCLATSLTTCHFCNAI